MNYIQLYNYIKTHGITLAYTDKDFFWGGNCIPAGTLLYFGISHNGLISTYDDHISTTKRLNESFNYNFCYEKESYWRDRYTGKFILKYNNIFLENIYNNICLQKEL